MKFSNPSEMDRCAAEDLLSRGSDDEIRETLVAISLNEADWTWVQEKCLHCSRHPNWSVRAVAATCFGHLARIHRTLELPKVLPRLMDLLDDPMTADYAQNALDDIRTYMPGMLEGHFQPRRS
ncbi:MAG: hypothetical protein IT372_28605 [Polyangiaceae bacterium]|nr:hypothetical protein [Polyangiaceae bacterium]